MDERVPPALAATGVSKTFPGQKALDDVSLEVGAGEVHALLGENGSGKSTLIKILAGAYVPDPGADVFVNGQQLPLGSPAASFERGLRFVHQKLGVVQEMNAVENVALEAGFTRAGFIDWKAQERLTRRLLERFDVEIDVWRPLRESRAVERSLVAIARALRPSNPDGQLHSGEVPLVVLDEPTSSLPAAEVESLFGIVRDLAAAGIAVIYVSHRLDEVFEIADRVSVLRDGRRTATSDVASLSRGELVQLIVGREIKTSWSRPVRATPRVGERAALQVRCLHAGRVSGVSFDVGQGEVLGVAGVTGSGRELLARAVAGAVLPDTGCVTVAGERLRDVTPREALRAGVVLALGNTQPHSAIARFSTAENLTLCSLPKYSATGRLRRRRERCDAADWMKQLDVRPLDPERLYDLLSGGNQQKVILGKSLMAAPKVLVLDEPTAGVDVGARQAIYRLIAEQADAGLGVLLCSSDAEDIVTLSDRAIVMRDGRVVAELAREDVNEHNLLLEAVGEAVGDVGA